MILFFPLGLLVRRSPDATPKIFEPGHTRIRCPLCAWEPAKTDTWLCSPGCGETWNTFVTAGICPTCAKHWTHTACLRCGQWSPHDAWYEQTQGEK